MRNNPFSKLIYTVVLISTCTIFMAVDCGHHYDITTSYNPVFISRAALEKSVRFDSVIALSTPSKIYYEDNYIFISEQFKGIHIYNNEDPSKPYKVGFIYVIGCIDVALKEAALYVDNATDLVTIDLTNPLNPSIVSRIPNVFPEPAPPDLGYIPSQYNKQNRGTDMVLVSWVKK